MFHFNLRTKISQKLWELARIFSNKMYSSSKGAYYGHLGFKPESHFLGHFKVNFLFLSRNEHFWHRIWKEGKMLRSDSLSTWVWYTSKVIWRSIFFHTERYFWRRFKCLCSLKGQNKFFKKNVYFSFVFERSWKLSIEMSNN